MIASNRTRHERYRFKNFIKKMTKRVKYTAICKEWKLINLHLRFEFLMPTFPLLFGMSFMIIQIIYKLNPTPFALRTLF